MKTHDIGQVVRGALENARRAGLSYAQQNEHAVRALRQVAPDLTGEQALEAVSLERQKQRMKAGASNY